MLFIIFGKTNLSKLTFLIKKKKNKLEIELLTSQSCCEGQMRLTEMSYDTDQHWRYILTVSYQYDAKNHERSYEPRQRILIITCKNYKPIKGFFNLLQN